MNTMAGINRVEAPHNAPPSRWGIVALVSAAIAISYFDRQTVSVAIAAIQRTIPISNEQFSYLQTGFLLAYAAMYPIGGRMLDKLGTRFGFLLIMLWWSLACMLHGFASSFAWLLVMRCLLGIGEGGAFPAATRVVSEWLAPCERATAMGSINAGTAVGSLLAPPLIGLVLIYSGWRAVFFAAGALGLIWVLCWALWYDRTPSSWPGQPRHKRRCQRSFPESGGDDPRCWLRGLPRAEGFLCSSRAYG
jgi:ACS family hexuronate transporter-like MFS transporter